LSIVVLGVESGDIVAGEQEPERDGDKPGSEAALAEDKHLRAEAVGSNRHRCRRGGDICDSLHPLPVVYNKPAALKALLP